MIGSSEVPGPRIPPRPRETWDDEVREALAVLRPPGALAAPRPAGQERPVSNILGIFAWHPGLTKAWLLFNNHLFHSTLSARTRELVTIRVCWARRGEYEWVQHVRMGRKAGLSDAEIDAISEGPDAAIWGSLDAALLRAADEMCADHNISSATWDELEKHLDRQEIMDLVFTVGAYDMLSMAFNTFGLELEPGLEGFPAILPSPGL